MPGHSLITNRTKFLHEVINNILPSSQNLFFLVGYFYFSGYRELYKNLRDKNLKILVGMDIEPAFQNKIKEFQLLEKVERSRVSIQDDFYRSLVCLCNDTDFFERAAPAAQEDPSGPSPGALIGAPGLPVITPGVPHASVTNWDSIKSFWRSRNLFSKRGRRPQPKKALRAIFRRTDWCAEDSRNSPGTEEKIVFLISFFKLLIKRFLAAGGIKTKTGIEEKKLENLLSYSREMEELEEGERMGEGEKRAVIDALDQVRIIDPACGSGAFPMGVLQKMVLILEKVDPGSEKWLEKFLEKVPYAFRKQVRLVKLVDFGDLPVFENTTTYPCILVAANLEEAKPFDACNVEALEYEDLKGYLETLQFKVDPGHLQDGGWMLAGERMHRLMEKIKAAGIPLGEYVDHNIYRGILTGLNEAFVIDGATRNRLIGEDPGSAELIKPFLLGRDVKRYEILKEENFLILIPRGWTRQYFKKDINAWGWFSKQYPALAAHLGPFKEKAEKRCDKGEFWWELRSCDYYEEFEKPKIIYPNICQRPEFTFDKSGLYTNQKCFIIPVDDKYLLGILNSKLSYFIFRQVLPKLRGDFFEPGYKYMKEIPIPRMDLEDKGARARNEGLAALVEQMLELQQELQSAEDKLEKERLREEIEEMDGRIDEMVYGLYGLTEEEIALVEKEMSYNKK